MSSKERKSIEQPLPLDFFRIQSVFAQKVSVILNIPIEEALLKYTSFYKRIGIKDWEFDKGNSRWQEFVKTARETKDFTNTAYEMYLKKFGRNESSNVSVGCFSYDYDSADKTVSIHFQNNFSLDSSPLSKENVSERRKELREIFDKIKSKYPDAKNVSGGSWLYSYESYRRLFPKSYIANLHQEEGGFRGHGTWGQFLKSSGELNQERTNQFLDTVNNATNFGELQNAFPMKYLETQAPVEDFYGDLEIK